MVLLAPHRRQFRPVGRHVVVFAEIGKGAPFGNAAKIVEIFACNFLIPRIQHEVGVFRRVFAHPLECFRPLVARRAARPFDMRAVRIQNQQLRNELSGGQRHKNGGPAPGTAVQKSFFQKPAAQQDRDHRKKMQRAHGLQRNQSLQAGRAAHNDSRQHPHRSAHHQPPAQVSGRTGFSPFEPFEPSQQRHRHHKAQPGVPRPAERVVQRAMRGQRLSPGRIAATKQRQCNNRTGRPQLFPTGLPPACHGQMKRARRGHGRVKRRRSGHPCARRCVFPIQQRRQSKQQQRRRQRARMKIFVGYEQQRPAHRQRKHRGDRRRRRPLRPAASEATPRNLQATAQQQPDRKQLPQKHRPIRGQVRRPHEIGDQLVREHHARLKRKKRTVVRI